MTITLVAFNAQDEALGVPYPIEGDVQDWHVQAVWMKEPTAVKVEARQHGRIVRTWRREDTRYPKEGASKDRG